jgi:hypothetical protein
VGACGRVGVWACGRCVWVSVGVWACGRVGVWVCRRLGGVGAVWEWVWVCGCVVLGVVCVGISEAPAVAPAAPALKTKAAIGAMRRTELETYVWALGHSREVIDKSNVKVSSTHKWGWKGWGYKNKDVFKK